MTVPTIPSIWTAQYPELGTGPVPVEPVISPEYFELERERIFRRVWLNVCREEDLPNPGDHLVKDIAVTNSSVIVVRGKDGLLRAFHNICRHRGNKLAWSCDDGTSNCKAFSCKFHGWTFNLEGQLGGVPDEDQFFDLDKASLGMLPVHLDTWEGFVFIHLAEEPDETLSEYLGEFGKDVAGYPFTRFSTRFSYRMHLNVNWKVALDAFQEFYHLAFIHKDTVANAVRSAENPLAHPLYMKLYDRHRLFSGPANFGFTPRPVELVSLAAGMATLIEFVTDDAKRIELPDMVNPTKAAAWSMDIDVVFPHFVIGMMQTMYYTYHFWPVAVDRTTMDISIYAPPVEKASSRFAQEHNRITARDTLFEDTATMERTQAALATGALKEFMLQDMELPIRHGHKVVEDYVGFYRQDQK